MSAGTILRAARLRHGVDQRTMARRAGTTQAQISRIERGEISPTVGMLERLLLALGERLELRGVALAAGNRSTAELRSDLTELSPGERVAQAAELSHALTQIAAGR